MRPRRRRLPARPPPQPARRPAGSPGMPRAAESRPAALRGDAEPRAPGGAGRARGRRAGTRLCPSAPRRGTGSPAPVTAPTWGARAGRTHLRGAGAELPGGLRGAAVVAIRGAPVRHRPPARSAERRWRRGPRAGRGGKGRGETEGRPARPARPRELRLRGGTAPAPPSPAESLRVPPKVRPAESGTVGDASHCPVHLPPETASSLHVSIPLPAAGRPLRDARTESRSRRAELPGAAATADFCRRGPGKAPRRQPGHLRAFPAASSGSPRPVSAAQRRAGQHRGCILLLSTSKCDPSPVHPSLVFPKAGRVCQVKGEPWQEMPLAEFRLGYSTVFCSFPA